MTGIILNRSGINPLRSNLGNCSGHRVNRAIYYAIDLDHGTNPPSLSLDAKETAGVRDGHHR